MAYLRSNGASAFPALAEPGPPGYTHGADTKKGGVPLAWQVVSPYDCTKALLPHALISHINPSSLSETFSKKREVIQTRGGFVEQHWGDDLTDISAEQSTGAFVNIATGLAAVTHQKTIAWDRYQDLVDLYRNNGAIYHPLSGEVLLQGWVLLMYDRGMYLGTFRNFSVTMTDTSPFAFNLSWSFKVEHTIQQVPNVTRLSGTAPTIQQLNTQG